MRKHLSVLLAGLNSYHYIKRNGGWEPSAVVSFVFFLVLFLFRESGKAILLAPLNV